MSTTADNDLYRGSYPVMRVALAQARIYAAWAGGSLPTEAQWLRAYRGDDGQTYPWGNQASDAIQPQHRYHATGVAALTVLNIE